MIYNVIQIGNGNGSATVSTFFILRTLVLKVAGKPQRKLILPDIKIKNDFIGKVVGSDFLREKELRDDFVVVDAFDPRVAPAVAAAVAKVAIETDVARVKIDPEVVRERAAARIGR